MPNPMLKLINQQAILLAQQLVNASNQTKTFSTQTVTSAYAATKSDAGQIITVSSGTVYITPGIFNPGDIIYIYNSSNSAISITPNTGAAIYLANGSSSSGAAASGTRTLAGKGYTHITCVAANTFVISSGSGVF